MGILLDVPDVPDGWLMISWGIILPQKIGDYANPRTGNPHKPTSKME